MAIDKFEDYEYELGLMLKQLRKSNNLTQKQVAEKLNCHISSVRHYEDGSQSPPIDNLRSLARLYKTTVDHMLGMDDRKFVYIGDLPPHGQKIVEGMIEVIKDNLNQNESIE